MSGKMKQEKLPCGEGEEGAKTAGWQLFYMQNREGEEGAKTAGWQLFYMQNRSISSSALTAPILSSPS